MVSRASLSAILRDDAITRGLGDMEARILIEWLVERAEKLATLGGADSLETALTRLCRRARTIGRFVDLWCHRRAAGAASQLAASEQVAWPLPTARKVDACDLMQVILKWEERNAAT